MAEQKENRCGDGQTKAGTDDVRAAYGKAVANAAINEMHSKAEEGTLPLVDDAEVAAFINACAEAKEDIFEVVQHIARREGLDLAADCVPKDIDKARLWSFLTSVLEAAIVGLAKATVQRLVAGDLDWREMLGMVGRNGEVKVNVAGKVAERKSGRSYGRCYVTRRNGCAALEYAFTW
jgi:hypothetical protein